MKNLTFTATVFREGKMYVAHTPELNVSTRGYTPQEAKDNLLDAEVAAEAALCAGDEGKFWEMHDKIFAEQDKKGEGTVGVEGAPTIFVNGLRVVGAQPFEVFAQIIETELQN